MAKNKRKRKTWNVILFSGAKSQIKKLKVSRLFLINLINLFILIFMIVAGYIFLLFQEKDLAQEELYKEINKRDLKVAEVQSEVEAVKREYENLQEEALQVKRSIEKFKEYEKKLSEVELEIPGEGGGGSGGVTTSLSNESSIDVSRRMMELREELPSIIEEFEKTVERILAYEEELRTIPTIMPTEGGRVTSSFGYRRDPFTWSTSFHSGIDIAGTLNTPILSTADGTVVQAGWDGSYGRKIVIEHGETYSTIYAHLNIINVQVGDKVIKGEVIGGMGTTGRSTGVHLHYEIMRNGAYVDPYLYMTFHESRNY